jgi:hypothetical protein
MYQMGVIIEFYLEYFDSSNEEKESGCCFFMYYIHHHGDVTVSMHTVG